MLQSEKLNYKLRLQSYSQNVFPLIQLRIKYDRPIQIIFHFETGQMECKYDKITEKFLYDIDKSIDLIKEFYFSSLHLE